MIRTNCFIIYKGIKYEILGGYANLGSTSGVGHFHSGDGMGSTWADVGFLGCATEEIAKYISSKFGKLITEAKYGDLEGIQIL